MVKMLLKEEVGGRALNSHGNYIDDHGKSWKNHGIVYLLIVYFRNSVSVLDEEQEPPPDTASGITGEPEPMSEKDLREASTAIDVFGYPLVSDNNIYNVLCLV